MTRKALFSLILALGYFQHSLTARAKEIKPTGWAYIRSEQVEARGGATDRRRALGHLGRGALVEVHESVVKGSASWRRVLFVDLETLKPVLGWVDSRDLESIPLDQFPTDSDLLKQLGGGYLDDFVKSHIEIARYLVRVGSQVPALVCFLASAVLPQSRLQVFLRSQGRFVPGAYLEFPHSEMKAAITAMEVLNLVGDDNECLVTHEPFDFGPENRGINLVIRRVEDSQFKKLWEAPLEYRNLASFPPQLQILKPPERNLGIPGTIATGTVEFRGRGSLREPIWRGKIEFHAFGRDEALETLAVEKVCAWDGSKFAPLR